MKKEHGKIRYISTRVSVLTGMILLGLSVIMVVEMTGIYRHGDSAAPLILTALLALFLSIVFFAWIYRPFCREETLRRQFLDGYMILDAYDQMEAGNVMLTPESKRENEKIREILMSTNLFILNKRQAQYLALQNQINPHFLYNTLDGIRSEALIAGVDSVADMTEALATFFRYTISKVDNLVTVGEELNNCEIYFKIQQYRFGDRIRLVIDFEEDNEDEIRNCLIPKLSLQPILENSIIHGTELKLGKGTQTIHLSLTESRLLICVSDDGVGMDEKALAKLNQRLGRNDHQISDARREKKGGIALYNVNHRIHLIFGEEYGLHIYSLENVGTDVEISIPAISDERELTNHGVLK